LDDYPNSFALVQIHWNNDYATTWGDDRAVFYGVPSTPTSWFDGVEERLSFPTTPSYEDTYLARVAVSTDVTIEMTSVQISGPTYEVTATVCIEPGGLAKDMRIYMVQVLDNWPVEIPGIMLYTRNGLKQAAASQDISLDPDECQQIVRTFTFDEDSWTQQADIVVVAWAQEPLASGAAEVYQARSFWPAPLDCNENDIPDWCDLDCGPSGGPCDVTGCGESNDCNANEVPDECDVADGTSADANENDIPDECEATVLYVDADSSGLNQGTTWTDAYTDLQSALHIAALPDSAVTEIWVAAGTYRPSKRIAAYDPRTATFQLADQVAVYGGFAGGETELGQRDPAANETILSGDLDQNDQYGDCLLYTSPSPRD